MNSLSWILPFVLTLVVLIYTFGACAFLASQSRNPFYWPYWLVSDLVKWVRK